MWRPKCSFDGPTAAVAATSLGAELVGVVYSFYYIKVFVNIYGLDERWLAISQLLFMVWNAINDPLFGFVQDFGCGGRCGWVRVRRKVILYCAPLYVLSFMSFWLPWTEDGSPAWLVGLHLLVSLFLFDTAISLAISAQCGLFAELSTSHSDRVRLAVYMEIAHLIGSLAIFPVDKLSQNLRDFRTFQICCGVLSVLAFLCFLVTGLKAPLNAAHVKEFVEMSEENSPLKQRPKSLKSSLSEGIKGCGQMLQNRDFLCVVLGNFFHILRIVGMSNFLVIFTENLIARNGVLPMGSYGLSLFYQACGSLPKVLLILLSPILRRLGAWRFSMIFLCLGVCNSGIVLLLGRHAILALAGYLFFEKMFSKVVYPSTYNVFFADIIDDDMRRNERSHPLSTMHFTLNALLTKPAISFAPMIIIFLLNGAGYHHFIAQERNNLNLNLNTTMDSLSQAPEIRYNGSYAVSPPNGTSNASKFNEGALFDRMFLVACLFPALCALVEVLCLLPYRLKNRHRRRSDSTPTKTDQLLGQNDGDATAG